MPISFKDLATFFGHLGEVTVTEGCSRTPKITKKYFLSKNLNIGKILPWLREYGGDCEVLANIENTSRSEIKKIRN